MKYKFTTKFLFAATLFIATALAQVSFADDMDLIYDNLERQYQIDALQSQAQSESELAQEQTALTQQPLNSVQDSKQRAIDCKRTRDEARMHGGITQEQITAACTAPLK